MSVGGTFDGDGATALGVGCVLGVGLVGRCSGADLNGKVSVPVVDYIAKGV